MSTEDVFTQASVGPDAPDPTQQDAPDSGQAPAGSTPTPEAPSFAEGSFNPNDLPADLQPVYKQMQAAYTQKTQSLAEQRREAEQAVAFMQALGDEENRVEALRQLSDFVGQDAYLTAAGYEFEDDGTPAPQTNDNPPQQVTDPRVDELAQWRDELLANQQEAELISQIEGFTENEFTRLGLTEDDVDLKELVLGRATVYDLDERGMPQIQQAYQDVQNLLDNQQKQWIKSKSAPRGPSPGQPGTEDTFVFTDPDQRQALMASRLEGFEQ